jgi:geranylgeranyl pyrophosphate synthase/uncharacterized protein with NAD-binding domain and iron-sulfur cluster
MPTRVIVLGGGVAGMSAAHELIERGFEVVVLEERDIAGGKARSIPVIDDGTGTSGHERADTGTKSIQHRLPGEHGFRFFPGFYKHVIDTMRRTPSFDGRQASDHLVPTTRVGFTQYGKPTFVIPSIFPQKPADAATLLRDILLTFSPVIDLTPDDLALFGARFWQILTSCEERRIGEYERVGWWDFIGAEGRSAAYQKFLATGFTRSLVAAKARKASARTVGDMFEQMMLTFLNPTEGTTDRLLDGPTNLVWIDPWLSYLESKGVRYLRNMKIEQIFCDQVRITGVGVRHGKRRTVFYGDHYVAALPLERFAPLVNHQMLYVDQKLADLRMLAPNVEWMNGLQFYLRRDLPITHGHVIHIDTEWALTSVSQVQFWRSMPPADFGDDEVRGVISVDVSDWDDPGSNGRPAMQCTREEVMREVWKQIKRSINFERELLRDEDLHSWFLDPDIRASRAHPRFLHNAEPLLVNLIDTWKLRPEAITAIPNLFLASDYVRTYTDLATMEGANEAARRAVNGLLDAVKFTGPRCEVWPLQAPEVLAPWRLHDAARYRAGLPWDDSLMQVAAQAIRGASPLLEQARPLLEKSTPFVNLAAGALEGTDMPATDFSDRPSFDPRVGLGAIDLSRPAPERMIASAMPLSGAAPLAGAMPLAGDAVGPTGFLDRLSWYREMLAAPLAAGIPSGEPQAHLYGLVKDFIDRSGKGLRPALCIATARALGGRTEDAFPAAAGIEMLHNAFLVHDDIEDGSESRRGVATMHRRVGIPIAVNTGDAMNALAMRFFRRSVEQLGPMAALRILDEVDHMLVETLEGQATELGWVRDNDLGVDTDGYLRLVLKKTAWYSFIHPMRIGALVADADDQNLDRFDRFGYLLGVAFQITDDVLNLVGDVGRYGKEIDGDLWEGKRTIVLTHALSHANAADRAWIGSFLARPRERRLPREVLRLHRILASSGSIAWAQQAAATFAEAAAREFDGSAFAGVPQSPDLDWLRAWVDFLVRRDA